MNDILDMIARIQKTLVCNIRIVKHRPIDAYSRSTYTVEELSDNGRDWVIIGCMNIGGGITFYKLIDYHNVSYAIESIYSASE